MKLSKMSKRQRELAVEYRKRFGVAEPIFFQDHWITNRNWAVAVNEPVGLGWNEPESPYLETYGYHIGTVLSALKLPGESAAIGDFFEAPPDGRLPCPHQHRLVTRHDGRSIQVPANQIASIQDLFPEGQWMLAGVKRKKWMVTAGVQVDDGRLVALVQPCALFNRENHPICWTDEMETRS